MNDGDKLYVLFLGFTPMSAHRRFEGASEKMAGYTAEEQKSMRIVVLTVEE